MKEKWMKYNKKVVPEDKYEVVSVLQDCEGTIITLEGEKYMLKVKFAFVDAVRMCDEGRRIRTYNDTVELQSYRKDFFGSPMYIIDNSQFIKWLIDESAGIYDEFTHYAIVTLNDIVDIISSEPPEIEIDTI